jgi:hypothetical protein
MPPRKTPQQGCSTTIRAAIDPNLSSQYFPHTLAKESHTDRIAVEGSIFLSDTQVTLNSKVIASYSLDKKNAERCWRLSEELIGQKMA